MAILSQIRSIRTLGFVAVYVLFSGAEMSVASPNDSKPNILQEAMNTHVAKLSRLPDVSQKQLCEQR